MNYIDSLLNSNRERLRSSQLGHDILFCIYIAGLELLTFFQDFLLFGAGEDTVDGSAEYLRSLYESVGKIN